MFLVAWFGWLVLGLMAMTDGCPDNCNNPEKLVYGFDANGCMCSKDCTADLGVDNSNKKALYLPDPRDSSIRICVETCPANFSFSKSAAVSAGTFLCPGGVCDVSGSTVFYLERIRGAVLSLQGSADNCFLPGSNSTDCWYPSYPSSEVFYKCIPTLPNPLSESDKAAMESLGLPVGDASFSAALSVMSNPGGEIGKLTAELYTTWPLLIFGVIIAVLLGFVYTFLIRMFAMVMLWICTVGLLFVMALCTAFAWDKTGKVQIFSQISDATGANITALADAAAGETLGGDTEPALVESAAWILTICTGVYFVILFFMLKRIIVAVKVIIEAAKAMAAMPFLIAQPIFTFLSLCILYLWAGIVTMYLISAGEFDPATGTFVYAGGTCKADLTGTNITAYYTTLAITVTFTSAMTSSAGPLVISHSALKGTGCSFDSLRAAQVCTGGVFTPSNPSFGIGSCFGDHSTYGTKNCSMDVLNKAKISAWNTASSLGGTPGSIDWAVDAGNITFKISDGVSVAAGESFSFVANINTSSAVSVSVSGSNNGRLDYSIATTVVPSGYTIRSSEALRACNLKGNNKDRANTTLVDGKLTALAKQGVADLNELSASPWVTQPTLDNWKSFLPVTLDANTYNYFVLYHLFMFLWTNNFTESSGYFIVCGAVAAWYWTMDKKDFPRNAISQSTFRYARYHTGTVAVGSFIIAVVQMIRILFNYFVNKSKQFKDNPVVKALVCIVNCCLWCLEKVIGYINKNAYIMSATHGHSFCKAAFKGFMLLLRNILRVAAVNVVAISILFIGKLFILFTSVGIVYLISQQYATDLGLSDGAPFLTLLICFIMTFYVASSFMDTFSAAVDTIFLSFLHDQEVNNGKDKQYFMADSLRSAIGVSNKVTPEG
eukprot:CAMPEP_0184306614 /NCGR_PEP_ID=MMETSP1049-20130417/15559_1 /TAXON_ID=77928 /ORGANISM="Proteomonas sulcata, Strain CCMP704" /LENGTH=888 /DNA_ID=CAMNT_0026618915 /DNA_START=75 /DNA_END=2741 /DNA_ORIENTATION=+